MNYSRAIQTEDLPPLTIKDRVYLWVYDNIPFRVRNFYYEKIRSIFKPQHQRIRKIIPRTWCDLDSVFLKVNFEIIKSFYEDEFIDSNSGGYYHYRDNPKLRYQAIVWDVYKKQVNTGTIRYDAEGNGDRPFNSIYIPYDIYLSERPVPRRLQVMIKWLS